jgi:hypothetical protein
MSSVSRGAGEASGATPLPPSVLFLSFPNSVTVVHHIMQATQLLKGTAGACMGPHDWRGSRRSGCAGVHAL